MKRRKPSLDPARFPPLAEFPIKARGRYLTYKMIGCQVEAARQKVLAAAPAIAHLECLELDDSIERKGEGFAIAMFLVEKRQQELRLEPLLAGDDRDRALRRDIKALVDSVVETQARLDRLVALHRKDPSGLNETTPARALAGAMRTSLERDDERLLEVLRRHGGSALDLLLPDGDEIQTSFPFYPGGSASRSEPLLLRAIVKDFNCGYAKLFRVSREIGGEWAPVTGLKDMLQIEWPQRTVNRATRALALAAMRGHFVDIPATLIEAGIPRIPVKAELNGQQSVTHVRAGRNEVKRSRRIGGSKPLGATLRLSRR